MASTGKTPHKVIPDPRGASGPYPIRGSASALPTYTENVVYCEPERANYHRGYRVERIPTGCDDESEQTDFCRGVDCKNDGCSSLVHTRPGRLGKAVVTDGKVCDCFNLASLRWQGVYIPRFSDEEVEDIAHQLFNLEGNLREGNWTTFEELWALVALMKDTMQVPKALAFCSSPVYIDGSYDVGLTCTLFEADTEFMEDLVEARWVACLVHFPGHWAALAWDRVAKITYGIDTFKDNNREERMMVLSRVWSSLAFHYQLPQSTFENARVGAQPTGFECGVLAVLALCEAAVRNCKPNWKFTPGAGRESEKFGRSVVEYLGEEIRVYLRHVPASVIRNTPAAFYDEAGILLPENDRPKAYAIRDPYTGNYVITAMRASQREAYQMLLNQDPNPPARTRKERPSYSSPRKRAYESDASTTSENGHTYGRARQTRSVVIGYKAGVTQFNDSPPNESALPTRTSDFYGWSDRGYSNKYKDDTYPRIPGLPEWDRTNMPTLAELEKLTLGAATTTDKMKKKKEGLQLLRTRIEGQAPTYEYLLKLSRSKSKKKSFLNLTVEALDDIPDESLRVAFLDYRADHGADAAVDNIRDWMGKWKKDAKLCGYTTKKPRRK